MPDPTKTLKDWPPQLDPEEPPADADQREQDPLTPEPPPAGTSETRREGDGA